MIQALSVKDFGNGVSLNPLGLRVSGFGTKGFRVQQGTNKTD